MPLSPRGTTATGHDFAKVKGKEDLIKSISGENIILSDTLIKINHRGKRQTRVLVVTERAVYNFKPDQYKKFQRRIDICTIDSVCRAIGLSAFVLRIEGSYDYKFESDRRDLLLEVLKNVYHTVMNKSLPIATVNTQAQLDTVLTSKKEAVSKFGTFSLGGIFKKKDDPKKRNGSFLSYSGGGSPYDGEVSDEVLAAGGELMYTQNLLLTASVLNRSSATMASSSGHLTGESVRSPLCEKESAVTEEEVVTNIKRASARLREHPTMTMLRLMKQRKSSTTIFAAPKVNMNELLSSIIRAPPLSKARGEKRLFKEYNIIEGVKKAAIGGGKKEVYMEGSISTKDVSRKKKILENSYFGEKYKITNFDLEGDEDWSSTDDSDNEMSEEDTFKEAEKNTALSKDDWNWLAPPENSTISIEAFRLLYLIRVYGASTALPFIRSTIPSRPRNSDVAVASLVNSVLNDKVASYELSQFMVEHLGYSRKLFSSIVRMLLSDDDIVRVWTIKSLWILIPLFQGETRLKSLVIPDGFPSYVREALRGRPMDHSTYVVLMQLLLGVETGGNVLSLELQTFGKRICNPQILPVLFELIPECASTDLKRDIMKEINVVLINDNGANIQHFIKFDGWELWFVNLLIDIPRDVDLLTDAQDELAKYVVNACNMILHNEFTHGTNFAIDVNHTIDLVATFSGWGYVGVDFTRSLLRGLIGKIVYNAHKWTKDFKSTEWDNLIKLGDVLEEFVLFRPVNYELDSETQEESTMLIRDYNDSAIPERNASVHIDPVTSECQDLILVERFVLLLKKVGMTTDEISEKEKQVYDKEDQVKIKSGHKLLRNFVEIADAFTKYNSNLNEADPIGDLSTDLSEYLSHKKHNLPSNKSSKGAMKKSLETSITRQQLQTQIRQAKIENVNIPSPKLKSPDNKSTEALSLYVESAEEEAKSGRASFSISPSSIGARDPSFPRSPGGRKVEETTPAVHTSELGNDADTSWSPPPLLSEVISRPPLSPRENKMTDNASGNWSFEAQPLRSPHAIPPQIITANPVTHIVDLSNELLDMTLRRPNTNVTVSPVNKSGKTAPAISPKPKANSEVGRRRSTLTINTSIDTDHKSMLLSSPQAACPLPLRTPTSVTAAGGAAVPLKTPSRKSKPVPDENSTGAVPLKTPSSKSKATRGLSAKEKPLKTPRGGTTPPSISPKPSVNGALPLKTPSSKSKSPASTTNKVKLALNDEGVMNGDLEASSKLKPPPLKLELSETGISIKPSETISIKPSETISIKPSETVVSDRVVGPEEDNDDDETDYDTEDSSPSTPGPPPLYNDMENDKLGDSVPTEGDLAEFLNTLSKAVKTPTSPKIFFDVTSTESKEGVSISKPECSISGCMEDLSVSAFYEEENKVYCPEHYTSLIAPKCVSCRYPILDFMLMAAGNPYHEACLKCAECNFSFGETGKFITHDRYLFCEKDYVRLFLPFCACCLKPFNNEVVKKVSDRRYHASCFKCPFTNVPLKNGEFRLVNEWPVNKAVDLNDEVISKIAELEKAFIDMEKKQAAAIKRYCS